MASPPHLGRVCELELCESIPPRDGKRQPLHRLSPAGLPHAEGFYWTVLQRHGKRPLAVLGRALLAANNRCTGLPEWSEITLYETAGARLAASVCHQSAQAAGVAWCDAWLCEKPEAVRAILKDHDPLWALPFRVRGRLTEVWDGALLSIAAAHHEVAAAERFRGAWAGLLLAVFGPPPAHRRAP
jgi:hypothetical protein